MRKLPVKVDPAHFKVANDIHILGGVMEWTQPLAKLWGRAESAHLRRRLDRISIDLPIHITGLARAGTTTLLERIAAHPEVATHRYRDYPFLFFPWVWNRYLDAVVKAPPEEIERRHLDGIRITRESPEAMEEILWKSFFPTAHDPRVTSVLTRETSHPAYERFYRDHIKKILLLRGGTRYAAKGNCNITRLDYLKHLFPEARFVIAIRHPVAHIASHIKQHLLFLKVAEFGKRTDAYLRRAGHFEFGNLRTPINTGSHDITESIRSLWARGEDIRGTARLWADIYRFVKNQMESHPDLRPNCLTVKYEELCAEPREVLGQIYRHCRLEAGQEFLEEQAATIKAPTYYQPNFTDEELAIIEEETREIAALWGYRF